MASIGRIDTTPPASADAYAINRKGLIAIGHGQPVVLLHATLSSKSQWNTLAQRLAPRFQALALDLHGCGDHRALAAPRDFSIDDETDLVLAGLDCVLGCNARVHLVGHLYGGLVALQFALRHPALVASLTLYDPLAISLFEKGDPIIESFTSMGRSVSEHVAQRRSFEAAQVFFNFWSGDGAFERLSLPSKARLAGSAGQIALNFQAAARSPVRADVLAQLHAHTLLMTGSRSPLFAQRIVAMLARDLPAAKVNWIEGDHMAPLNAPERVHPWIETFLDVQAQNASAA